MREFELYLQSMRNEGRSETTIRNVKSVVGGFFDIMGIKNIDDIKKLKRTDIDFYIGKLYDAGNSDSSRQTKINTVRMFFNYLENRDVIDRNILKGVRISVAKKELYCPTIEEANTIVSMAAKNIDDYAIYYTLLTSGIRVGELINMKVEDISDGGVMIFGKGKKERYVCLKKKTVEILRSYIDKTRCRIRIMSEKEFSENRFCKFYKDYKSYVEEINSVKKNNFVFVTMIGGRMNENGINRRLKQLAKEAGVNPEIVSPHKIRHVYATNLLEQGVDMDVISSLLGHSNVSVTHSVYAKTSKGRMKEAIESVNFV